MDITNKSIAFPHLHIYLENVGKSFTIFGFEIAYYGVIIAIGMLLGLAFVLHEVKRTGQNSDNYFNMLIFAILAGIVGARVYFVAFEWNYYSRHLDEILNYRMGGLAIYGGIIGGVLAVFIYTRVKKMSFRLVADTCCMGLLIGQILGRFGNFFNREAFGDYTDSLFAMRLPRSAVRESDITGNIANHIVDGYIQVHPTFLYEAMWNFVLFLILFFFRKHKKYNGQMFLIYLFGYGLGRAWIEGLRTDQLMLPYVNLPVSQVLSVVLVIVCGTLLIIGHFHYKNMPEVDIVPAPDAGKTTEKTEVEFDNEIQSDAFEMKQKELELEEMMTEIEMEEVTADISEGLGNETNDSNMTECETGLAEESDGSESGKTTL